MSLRYSYRFLTWTKLRLLKPRVITSTEFLFAKSLKLNAYPLSFCASQHTYNINNCNCKISKSLCRDPLWRNFSTSNKPVQETDDTPSDPDKGLTVFQRFKKVYKEYGKTLLAVHFSSSVAWYGIFYLIAKSGIDLLPILLKFGASEAIQAKYMAGGDFLVAYIIYEITKPIRYLFTLGVTQQSIVYMRKKGYLPPIEPENKLRNLAKDSRDNIRDKYQEQKDDMKERYTQRKEKYKDKWDEVRHRGGLKRPSPRNYGVGHRHNGLPSHRLNGKLNKKPK